MVHSGRVFVFVSFDTIEGVRIVTPSILCNGGQSLWVNRFAISTDCNLPLITKNGARSLGPVGVKMFEAHTPSSC